MLLTYRIVGIICGVWILQKLSELYYLNYSWVKILWNIAQPSEKIFGIYYHTLNFTGLIFVLERQLQKVWKLPPPPTSLQYSSYDFTWLSPPMCSCALDRASITHLPDDACGREGLYFSGRDEVWKLMAVLIKHQALWLPLRREEEIQEKRGEGDQGENYNAQQRTYYIPVLFSLQENLVL